MLLFVSVWNREDTKQEETKKKEQTWARVTQKGGIVNPENLICLPGYSTGKLQAEQTLQVQLIKANLFYWYIFKQNAGLQYAFQSHNMRFFFSFLQCRQYKSLTFTDIWLILVIMVCPPASWASTLQQDRRKIFPLCLDEPISAMQVTSNLPELGNAIYASDHAIIETLSSDPWFDLFLANIYWQICHK